MVTYKILPIDIISEIKGLWLENAAHHNRLSPAFKRPHTDDLFEKRVASWEKSEEFFATAAYINEDMAGYCVSTIGGNLGTIESLYITPPFRKQGIGRKLMEDHLSFFKEKNCQRISVTTVSGNEEALAFYQSLGFLPRTVTLEYKN